MNTDSVQMMLSYAGKMILILGIVFAIALLTPWMAKQVRKVLPQKKSPERVENEKDKDVNGIYDAQRPEDTETHEDKDEDKDKDDGEADKNG